MKRKSGKRSSGRRGREKKRERDKGNKDDNHLRRIKDGVEHSHAERMLMSQRNVCKENFEKKKEKNKQNYTQKMCKWTLKAEEI